MFEVFLFELFEALYASFFLSNCLELLLISGGSNTDYIAQGCNYRG